MLEFSDFCDTMLRAIRSMGSSFIYKQYRPVSYSSALISTKIVVSNEFQNCFRSLASYPRPEPVDLVNSSQQPPLSNHCSWNQKPSSPSSGHQANATMQLRFLASKPRGLPTTRCRDHELPSLNSGLKPKNCILSENTQTYSH